ncbi:MAG: hypothetical protein C5B54_08715 [Acidobacteria bacterium]|nr:MAG: hypothetical protein C5B54_08715 [Acidobacteriota bacterium]
MKFYNLLFVSIFLFIIPFPFSAHAEITGIESVSVSKNFFNPTLGENVQIALKLSQSGQLSVAVIDRDGFLVRRLVSKKPVAATNLSLAWDGKTDAGEVVPNEAWNFKIDLITDRGTDTYFPANAVQDPFEVKVNYYDRRSGIVAYELPQPCRVHMQAGSASLNPKSKKMEGPVLKTIVNREPRTAGKVIEYWNGYDEGGTIYIPDVKNFVFAISLMPLSENSVISVGNDSKTFVDSVATRTGESLFTFKTQDHKHHKGLTAMQDVAPVLTVQPMNGKWDQKDNAWHVEDKNAELSVQLRGPSSQTFMQEPGIIFAFVDEELVSKTRAPVKELRLPIEKFSAGIHIVAINWATEYGPTSVNSFRLKLSTTEVKTEQK